MARAAAAPTEATAVAQNDDRCSVCQLRRRVTPAAAQPEGRSRNHGTMVLSADGRFYLFSTGYDIGAKSSSDLRTWRECPMCSARRPDRLARAASAGVSNLWLGRRVLRGAVSLVLFGFDSARTARASDTCRVRRSRAAMDRSRHVFCSNVSTTDNFNASNPRDRRHTTAPPGSSSVAFGAAQADQIELEGARDGSSSTRWLRGLARAGRWRRPFCARSALLPVMAWDLAARRDSTYNIRAVAHRRCRVPSWIAMARRCFRRGTLVPEGSARYRRPGHNAVCSTRTAPTTCTMRTTPTTTSIPCCARGAGLDSDGGPFQRAQTMRRRSVKDDELRQLAASQQKTAHAVVFEIGKRDLDLSG